MAVVAIILVAAIGGMVFSDFNTEEESPIVSLDVELEPGSLTVSHQSGDTLDPNSTEVIVETEESSYSKLLDEFEEGPGDGGRFSSGDNYQTFEGTPFSGDVTVTVVDVETNAVLYEDTHNANPDLLVNITSIRSNSPVYAGADDLTVDYRISNVNGPEDQAVELLLDGAAKEDDELTIEQGTNESGAFTTGLDDVALHDGLTVEVRADDGFGREDLSGPNVNVTIEDQKIDVASATPTVTANYSAVTTTNIGDVQDIELASYAIDGTEIDSASDADVKVGASDVTGNLTVDAEPGGEIVLSSANSSHTQTLGESDFQVKITNVTEPVNETEDLVVDYRVENEEIAPDVQDIQFFVDGQVITSETATDVTLAAGENQTGTFTYTTDRDDPPSVNASVSSDDDTNSTDVEVLAADYDLRITDVVDEIRENNAFDIDYRVDNDGEAPGDQVVQFSVDGDHQADSSDFVLGPDESSTGVFTYTPDDPDEPGRNIELNLTSEDQFATEQVRVLEDPEYEVTLTDVPNEVEEYDEFEIDYEVTNTGEVAGEQDIVFTIDGSGEGTHDNVTLDPAEDTTGTFNYTTERSDLPNVDVEVSSDNTSATHNVNILKNPYFEVAITDVQNEVDMGDAIQVDYEVTNTGDLQGTLPVEFDVDGESQGEQSHTLSAGASTTGTFSYTTDEQDPQGVDVTVRSNTSDTSSVDVIAPQDLVASLPEIEGEVGDTVTVPLSLQSSGAELPIGAYDLTVDWDDSVLDYQDAEAVGFSAGNVDESAADEVQLIDPNFDQNTPFTPMFRIEFEIVGSGDSDVGFVSGNEINDPDRVGYDVLYQDGGISVDTSDGSTSADSSGPSAVAASAPGPSATERVGSDTEDANDLSATEDTDDLSVSLGDVEGEVGDTVAVPVNVTSGGAATHADAYELAVRYDDDALAFEGIDGGEFGEPFHAVDEDGVVQAIDFNNDAPTPIEPMVYLEFEILEEGSSPLEFVSSGPRGWSNVINDPNLASYDATFADGSVGTATSIGAHDDSGSVGAATTDVAAQVSPTQVGTVPEYDVGDTNEDGDIALSDLQAIVDVLFGEDPSTIQGGINTNLADVSRTGEIELADAQGVAEYLVAEDPVASDLVVTNLTVTDEIVAGEEVNGSVTLENKGLLGTIQGINYTVAETLGFDDVDFDERVHAADLGPALEAFDNETTIDFTVEPTTAGTLSQGLFSEDDNATAPLTVNPAGVDSVAIEPADDQTIAADEQIDFEATAYDEFGNVNETADTEFTWHAEGDSITSEGVFDETGAAEATTTYNVSAEIDGVTSNETTVTVEPASVDSVEIEPASDQTITAGETVAFNATAYDEFGNVNESVDSEFTWDAEGGAITSEGVFEETSGAEAGTGYAVTASIASVSSPETTVTVEPAAVETVEITPVSDQTISAGETIDFEATAEDQYGNVNESADSEFTWSAESGSISGDGLFDETTAAESGTTYDVTATLDSVSSFATTVTVEPAAVDRVEISPTSETIDAGGTVEFTATAYDAHDNVVESSDSALSWATDNGASVDGSGEFTSTNAAEDGTAYDVTAEFNGESAGATVTVEPAATTNVGISPSGDQNVDPTAGETVDFNATAYDTHDNVVESSDGEFSWTGDGGTISGSGLFDESTPGDYDVTASFGGETSSVTTVTVLEPPAFDVTITGTNTPVEGDDVVVDVTIENHGEITDTQTIDLDISGLGSDSTTVSNLGGGDSTSEQLSVGTSTGDDGTYSAEVSSDDDTDSQSVTVLEQPYFDVTITSTNTPVEGDSLDVEVSVENTGDVADTQTVSLDVNGLGSDSTTVSDLGGGDSTGTTLSVGTSAGDHGSYAADVSSDDDSDLESITVLQQAEFQVDILGSNSPVTEGESLTVSATIENPGDVSDTQTVTLDVPTVGSDSTTVNLDADSSTQETFSVGTETGDVGSYTAEVSSEDDSDSTDVEIEGVPDLEVSASASNSINLNDQTSLTIDFTVENVGTAADDDIADLYIDDTSGWEDSDFDVDVDPFGDTYSGSLTYTFDETDYNDGDSIGWEVALYNDGATASGSTSVSASPDLVFTNVDFPGTRDVGTYGDSTIEVGFTVENQGADPGSSYIDLYQGSASGFGSDYTHTGSLGPGDSYTSELSFTVDRNDAPSQLTTIEVSSSSDEEDSFVTVDADPVYSGSTLNVDASAGGIGSCGSWYDPRADSTVSASLSVDVDDPSNNFNYYYADFSVDSAFISGSYSLGSRNVWGTDTSVSDGDCISNPWGTANVDVDITVYPGGDTGSDSGSSGF